MLPIGSVGIDVVIVGSLLRHERRAGRRRREQGGQAKASGRILLRRGCHGQAATQTWATAFVGDVGGACVLQTVDLARIDDSGLNDDGI
jgi:hypothetical protein